MDEFELLSNIDLEYYCEVLKIKLNSITSKDFLNQLKPKEGCYIINLQDHNKGDGTHWTCFILAKKICCYFDPFGIILPPIVFQFAKRLNSNIKIIYSTDKIQDMKSIYCGWFCLYFLYFISIEKNRNMSVLLNKHNAKYDLQNETKNDLILKNNILKAFRNNIK